MKKRNDILILCIAFLLFLVIGRKESIKESVLDEKIMPKIVDIIIVDNYHIALCEDGTVWNWNSSTTAFSSLAQSSAYEKIEAQKISQLKDIMKIMEVGTEELTIYALSKDGFVYAWGSNRGLLICAEETQDKIFYESVKRKGLSDIVMMDANNGKAFALDRTGTFYTWGLPFYWNEIEDLKPGFPQDKKGFVEGVKVLSAGSGQYHYFIREDNTIFSIMEADLLDNRHIYPYIFPKLENRKENGSRSNKDSDSIPLLEYAIRLSEGSKFGLTILHELGTCEDVEKISSDGYTMFLYKKDHTLWYWNSDRIKYHDNIAALSDPETARIDYSGSLEEIDFRTILGIKYNKKRTPKIIDICPGIEYVLFLTDTGQVFMSEYRTKEIQDIEYYNTANTRADRIESTGIISQMHLKELSFQKLDLENIISINTDGNFHFSAVDEEGNYFGLDMTQNSLTTN